VSGRKKQDIMKDLVTGKYDQFPRVVSKVKNVAEEAIENAESDDEPTEMTEVELGFDYLLCMKIWSLTSEKVKQLKAKLAKKSTELEELMGKTPQNLWEHDLEKFLATWETFEAKMEKLEARPDSDIAISSLAKSSRGRGRKPAKVKDEDEK